MKVVQFGSPDKVPRQVELYYLPWLMQQTDMSTMDMKNLEHENLIPAILSKRVYRLQLAWHSFWFFLGCSGVNIGWCIWLYSQLKSGNRQISQSPFSNVNLIDSIIGYNQSAMLISKFDAMRNLNAVTIAKELQHVKIKVIVENVIRI